MMYREDWEGAVILLGIVGLIAGLICLALTLSRIECRSQWENSGLASDWGPIKGCLIRTADGHWIPAGRCREFGQPK